MIEHTKVYILNKGAILSTKPEKGGVIESRIDLVLFVCIVWVLFYFHN